MTLCSSIPRAASNFLALLLMAGGAAALQGAAPPPVTLQGELALRPLTPQDIKDYGLTGAQVASGLSTVGLGVPVHLQAKVNNAIDAADILSVSWDLASKPAGSAAELADSPLGENVPLHGRAERLVAQVAGRKFLRPDVAGQYTVTVAIESASYGSTNLTLTVNAGTYMGINTCALCHSGGQAAPNMVESWSQTRHATKLTREIDGLGSSHYGNNCISCHTVGFDTNTNAINGGFDDLAAQHGWTFPETLTNGNWAAMPQELKNLSNIQCENCHGPGSEHAYSLGNTDKISISWSTGNCGQCHDSKPSHQRNAEWNNSKHAIVTSYPTGPSRGSCVRCHGGKGFVDQMDGLSPLNTDYEPIGCATCHDPHDATNPHQLRAASATLADGTEITKGGTGTLCMNCHQARQNAATYAETASGSSHFGPHYGSASDMLAGVNAVTYGKIIPSSAHRDVVEDSCATCHMQHVDRNEPFFTKVGNHTFKVKWDGDTPEDPADDVELVNACTDCHGSIDTFNFPRQDFNGDGIIEGVQTEVHHLLDDLAKLLPPLGEPTVAIAASFSREQLRAAYNYSFVKYDGSYGVHNLAYAVGLLKASIADLTDDADKDGISDKWEIAQFGSVTVYNDTDDPDGDGVSNALEFAAGTNPMLADSDGDGISDLLELRAGSDPLNAEDTPGSVVKIYTAAELEFYSEVGTTYQIQAVSELNSTWENVGAPIEGTGDVISRVTSARSPEGKSFFRVVTLQ